MKFFLDTGEKTPKKQNCEVGHPPPPIQKKPQHLLWEYAAISTDGVQKLCLLASCSSFFYFYRDTFRLLTS